MDAASVTCATCRTRNEVPHESAVVPQCSQCQAYLPWIANATDLDFKAVVHNDNVLVCLHFWGAFANASRIMSPALDRVAAERAGRLKVVKVNVEDGRRAQSKHEARLVPTTVLLWRDEEIARHAGALELPALRRWVDQGLAAAIAASRGQS